MAILKRERSSSYDTLPRTAFEITRREHAERVAKTAKLRALRLQRDAASTQSDETSVNGRK